MSESESANNQEPVKRTWLQKFRSAFRGVGLGVKGPRQFESSRAEGSWVGATSPNSFWVHIPLAGAVIVAGLFLNVGPVSMGLLAFCIGLVIVAELLNTSLEFLAAAVTSEFDERIEAALDVASGAVLVASMVAVVVGGLVLGSGLLALLG